MDGDDYDDDARSVDSYDAVSPVPYHHEQSFTFIRELVSRLPGKKRLEGEEIPDVLYTTQYYASDGRYVATRQSATAPDQVMLDPGSNHGPDTHGPVIEIVNRVSAVPPPPNYARSGRYPDPYYRSDAQPSPCHMVIHSSHLRAALTAVIGYYPGFERIQKSTLIEAPYRVLVHRWKALEHYKLHQPACHDAEYAAVTAKHIDVLLDFLKENFAEKLALETTHWDSPAGATATYDLFWVLLEPGEIVYVEKDGQKVPHVISRVGQEKRDVGGQDSYSVYLWNVRFQKGRMQRKTTTVTIPSWNGERLINTLPVIPARFIPGGAAAMAEEQIKLGKRFWELAKQPSYKEYAGPLVDKSRKKGVQMTGRIIVDCEGFALYGEGPFRMGPPPPPPPHPGSRHNMEDNLPQVQPRCTCPACSKAGLRPEPSPWAGFDNLDPKTDNPPENKDLYFHVIGPLIPAFILGQRRWARVSVSGITDVKPDQDAFKYLVLDPEIKLTVKAMMGKFASLDGKLTPWPSDFVKNKGEGRIFLLHGSPGVGKTCTAECAAELARRPLLALTNGDLGPGQHIGGVENALNYFLTLGERFGALVLLDEADVYLEKRRTRDLHRNGLVSVFLRALEYYKGVLFLTTNRVEAFDDAFTSRIHVALHYKRLGDEDRRRIWMHNFERLERDSASKVFIPPSTRAYAFDSANLSALEWNGREIRNALQTAVALAETEALENGLETVAVEERHLRAVARMSGGFKDFLRGARGEGEDGDESDGEY